MSCPLGQRDWWGWEENEMTWSWQETREMRQMSNMTIVVWVLLRDMICWIWWPMSPKVHWIFFKYCELSSVSYKEERRDNVEIVLFIPCLWASLSQTLVMWGVKINCVIVYVSFSSLLLTMCHPLLPSPIRWWLRNVTDFHSQLVSSSPFTHFTSSHLIIPLKVIFFSFITCHGRHLSHHHVKTTCWLLVVERWWRSFS